MNVLSGGFSVKCGEVGMIYHNTIKFLIDFGIPEFHRFPC